jgi:hypothetical protein
MWQTIYNLFKFNEFKDAFLVDFVVMVKMISMMGIHNILTSWGAFSIHMFMCFKVL